MLTSCGFVNYGITDMIPRTDDHPRNPPKGYVWFHEAYFKQCHLWCPIPSLIISFLSCRRLAISQLTPAAICIYSYGLFFLFQIATKPAKNSQRSSRKLERQYSELEIVCGKASTDYESPALWEKSGNLLSTSPPGL